MTPIEQRPRVAPAPFPRAILATVLLVTCLAPLNATMIVVALPHVVTALRAQVGTGSLLVTSYLVVMAVLPPMGGRLGDRWGRRAVLLVGLALFGMAVLGASSARRLDVLIAWRVLQAVGAATAFPNALALLRDRVSAERRGLSFGLVGAVIALSAAAGPLIGQFLVARVDWRAVFWINLPLIGAAVGVAALSLRGRSTSDSRRLGPTRSHRAPFRSVLYHGGLADAALAMGLTNLAMYAALVGIPLLLGTSSSGYLLVALMGTAALAAPLGGRLADACGRQATAVAGSLILACGLLPVAILGDGLSLQAMAAGLVLAGAGLGVSSTAIQTSGIEAVDAGESGSAAGLLATSRYVGGAAGSGLIPFVMTAAPGAAIRVLFIVATAAALLASLAVSRPRLARGLAPRLRAEPDRARPWAE
jgi:MFS family permease